MGGDANGRLWAGTLHGLGRIAQAPTPGRPLFDRVFGTKDGLPGVRINALFRASDGKLWIGAAGGLAEPTSMERAAERPFPGYSAANGLRNVILYDGIGDRDRNLWVTSETGGAVRI